MKGNVSMAQQASTARARDELAKELEVRVNTVFKDYIQKENNGRYSQKSEHYLSR